MWSWSGYFTCLDLKFVFWNVKDWSRWGCLNLSAIAILGQIFLCCGCCFVHSRLFSSIPRLYLPDASSTFFRCDNQKYLQTLLNVPWGAKIAPGWKSPAYDISRAWDNKDFTSFLLACFCFKYSAFNYTLHWASHSLELLLSLLWNEWVGHSDLSIPSRPHSRTWWSHRVPVFGSCPSRWQMSSLTGSRHCSHSPGT